jgi:superfamily I DNA/RNA helicase
MITKVYGPAGTGKTTYIKQQIERLIAEGLTYEDIGFFSFSRAAIMAMTQKLNALTPPPYFRTFHSFGALLQGLKGTHIMRPGDWYKLCKEYVSRTPLTKWRALWEYVDGRMNYAVNAGITFSETLNKGTKCNFNLSDVYALHDAVLFLQEETYKRSYRDMLTLSNFEFPPLKAVFFDEAQDLSHAQVAILERLIKNADNAWVVGDPNQAVYGFAGNSETWLLDMPADETITLPKSYRLPAKVLTYSQQIAAHIGSEIVFQPKDEEGELHTIKDYQVPTLPFDNGESWLVLGRNKRPLHAVKRALLERGHSTYDLGAEDARTIESTTDIAMGIFAYRDMLKDGMDLPERTAIIAKGLGERAVECVRNREPLAVGCGLPAWDMDYISRLSTQIGAPIGVGTFHASKGLEATNVVVYTGCTRQQYRAWKDRDRGEVCPYYVACTRTKKRLFIVTSDRGYPYAF